MVKSRGEFQLLSSQVIKNDQVAVGWVPFRTWENLGNVSFGDYGETEGETLQRVLEKSKLEAV